MASVCRQNVESVTKNVRHCPRELSKLETKNGVNVQAKCGRWHTKKGDSVLFNGPGGHQKIMV
jgi:hypothetical protein